MKVFSADYLNELTAQAQGSPRKRQHRNIHECYEEPCQRTFNAIEPDSYLRPHQHSAEQGAETMIGIRGLMALVVFDGGGQILQVQRFGAGGAVTDPAIAAGTESPPGIWHSVVSLEPGSILLEVKVGPYDPDAPRYPAPWAPEEGSEEGKTYLANLHAVIGSMNSRPRRRLLSMQIRLIPTSILGLHGFVADACSDFSCFKKPAMLALNF